MIKNLHSYGALLKINNLKKVNIFKVKKLKKINCGSFIEAHLYFIPL